MQGGFRVHLLETGLVKWKSEISERVIFLGTEGVVQKPTTILFKSLITVQEIALTP